MLPSIELSKEQLLRLNDKTINYGGESIIVRPDIPNTVFKLYKESITAAERKNKTKKLELIRKRKTSFITQPKGVILSDKKIIGHSFDYDREDISLLLAPLTIEEKLSYLKRIKLILDYFKRRGIIYPDLKSDNVLLNQRNGRIKFCDIDSIQIDGLKTNMEEEYIIPFLKKGLLDESVHIYLHNLMTIDMLLTDTSDSYIDTIREIDLDKVKEYFNRDCQEIIRHIVNQDGNYQDLYLIDGINKENIVKYKKR